jgi:hypothetical protein
MILSFGNLLYRATLHQLTQANITEVIVDTITQVVPQVMGETFLVILTVMLTTAARGIHIFINRQNNFSNKNFFGATR